MEPKQYNMWLFVLAVAGTLFSGYMSAIKLFSQTCPFNEPCTEVFGLSACYYGFVMFAALLVLSAVQLFRKKSLLCAIKWVSLAGMLFSGYLSVIELAEGVARNYHYSLGLPTCAYGFVFYLLVFIFALLAVKKKKRK